MTYQINKAVVIGAGTMGAAIAAHLANAGVPVTLLDIVPKEAVEADPVSARAARNKIVNAGLENAKKSRPASFFSSDQIAMVNTGTIEDACEAAVSQAERRAGLGVVTAGAQPVRGAVTGPSAGGEEVQDLFHRVFKAADTDWPRIAALYDALAELSPSPVVELNRAVAVGMADGAAAGLAEGGDIERIATQPDYVEFLTLPAYDRLYERARVMPHGPERTHLYQEMARLVAAYAPWKVNTHRILTDMWHPWVVGYRRPLVQSNNFWKYVDIDPAEFDRRHGKRGK